jgi:hypothetical protein
MNDLLSLKNRRRRKTSRHPTDRHPIIDDRAARVELSEEIEIAVLREKRKAAP